MSFTARVVVPVRFQSTTRGLSNHREGTSDRQRHAQSVPLVILDGDKKPDLALNHKTHASDETFDLRRTDVGMVAARALPDLDRGVPRRSRSL